MNDKQKKLAIISGGIIAPILASSILAVGVLGASKAPENEDIYLDNLREVNEEITFEYGDRLEEETISVVNKNQEGKEIDVYSLTPAINTFEVGRTEHTAIIDGEEYYVDVVVEDTQYPEFEDVDDSIHIKGFKVTEEEIIAKLKKTLVARDKVDGEIAFDVKLEKTGLKSYKATAVARDYNGNSATKEISVFVDEDYEKVKEERNKMTEEQLEEAKRKDEAELYKINKENSNKKENQGDVLKEKEDKKQEAAQDPKPAERPLGAPMPNVNQTQPKPAQPQNNSNQNTPNTGLGLLTEITADQESPFSLDFSKIPSDVRNVKTSPIPWASLQKANLGNVIYNLNIPVSKNKKAIELVYSSNGETFLTIQSGNEKAFFTHTVKDDSFGFFSGEKMKFTEDELYEMRYISRLGAKYHQNMYFPKKNDF